MHATGDCLLVLLYSKWLAARVWRCDSVVHLGVAVSIYFPIVLSLASNRDDRARTHQSGIPSVCVQEKHVIP